MKKATTRKARKVRKVRKPVTQLVRVATAIGSTLGAIVAKAGTAKKALRPRTVRKKKRHLRKISKKS